MATLSGDSLNIDEHFNDENECINKIQQGDAKAFRAVVLAYYSELCNFAWHFVKSQSEAEDIVQDILANVWELREDWAPGGSIQAYLFRAVKNEALNHINHQQAEEKYLKAFQREKNQITSPKRFDESDRLERTVRQAIDELPERAQMVYKLHRRDGFTYNEIAYIMEISPKTVESQMSRALQILRDKLSHYLSLISIFVVFNTCLF